MKKWIEDIDKTTQEFLETFGGLNSEQLNWQPNSKSWSIAQNIEHLIIVNQSYFPIIESLKKDTYKTPFLSKIGFLVSFFGKTVLNAVKMDRKKKMITFPIWEPTKSEIPAGILNRFKEHQSELKNRIENSKELLEKGVIISSPANKNIVYKLEKAFDIIVMHEKRHFEQSKEINELLKTEAIR